MKGHRENGDVAPVPLPGSSLYLFLLSIDFSYYIKQNFTTNPGFWGRASLSWVWSRVSGWSRISVRVSLKGGVGEYVHRILDWSKFQNAHLQNIMS